MRDSNATLALPDHVLADLEEVAKIDGMTPAGWIAQRLRERKAVPPGGRPTMADLFAGELGTINSGGHERLSEEGSRLFAEHLEAEHRARAANDSL